ncbi:alpha/beta hydrolase [Paenisporosarcina cavernae]|nr:alpha/beta fold hydrolase [Paenisporosarcina cavernae]
MSTPIHILEPKGKNRHETVVIFHGWGSSIENYRQFANELCELGYEVMLPELLYHDSRGQLENMYATETIQRHFWEVIFHTLEEAKHILSAASNPIENTKVLGVSLGGFIASGILAQNPEIAGLVNINGSGAFEMSETIFRKESGREEMTMEERAVLRKVDPIHHPIRNKQILCVHGDADTVVSMEGQKEFVRSFEQSNELTFRVYPEVNHTITDEMSADVMAWLKK